MRPSRICRICTKAKKENDLQKLFDKNKRIITQIAEITGIVFKNVKTLPPVICIVCLNDLGKAREFRARCIASQEYFEKYSKKNQLQSQDLDIKTGMKFFEESINEPSIIALENGCNDSIDTRIEDLQPVNIKIEDKMIVAKQFNNLFRGELITKEITELVIDTKNVDVLQEELCDIDDSYTSTEKYSHELKIDTSATINDTTNPNATAALQETKQQNTKSKVQQKREKLETKKKYERKTFGCDQCDLDFHDKGIYANHCRQHTSEDVFHKGKRDERNSPMKDTETDDGGDIKSEKIGFVCDLCGKAFTLKGNFVEHVRRHKGEKLFICKICPEKFINNFELKLHVRKHTGEKPFACEFCGQRFINNSVRKRHERRRHKNIRPHACSECTKAFANSYILKQHMLTHTGERKFGCETCDRWFGRKTHLRTHFRSLTHKQNEEKFQQIPNDNSTANLDNATNLTNVSPSLLNIDVKIFKEIKLIPRKKVDNQRVQLEYYQME